ncbi:MAG: hypothetical protein ACP5UN_02390, partial [Candidatus Micrarchaeia archaeon]
MITKENLREDFSKKPELYYSTKIFKENNFVRKKCRICGKFFWTLDPDRDTCGDSEHSGYTFFKDKPLEVDYVEFWDRFANFFSKNGHKI